MKMILLFLLFGFVFQLFFSSLRSVVFVFSFLFSRALFIHNWTKYSSSACHAFKIHTFSAFFFLYNLFSFLSSSRDLWSWFHRMSEKKEVRQWPENRQRTYQKNKKRKMNRMTRWKNDRQKKQKKIEEDSICLSVDVDILSNFVTDIHFGQLKIVSFRWKKVDSTKKAAKIFGFFFVSFNRMHFVHQKWMK